MKYVYSRVGSLGGSGLLGGLDAGWLGGASARGLPHRRAWVANAGRNGGSDIWSAMEFTAPAPQRRPTKPVDGQEAYILQQDPNGLWFVDPWGDNAGMIRPADNATTARMTMPVNAGRDMGDTCFIIELAHTTQR